MDEIPPAEAFEPQPDQPTGTSRLRRRVQIAVTLTLVAALVVLAAVEGGGFIFRSDAVDTTPPPATARIAAVDAAGSLTTIDRLGGSVVAYSVSGVAFQSPAWSPDGSRVAAIGVGSDGTGVYVFAARTAADAAIEPIIVYESADRPPFYLFWTPDGRQVTFLTSEPDGLALRIAPAEASATDSIVRAGAPMYWDFVDPGHLLVHSGTTGPDGFLAEVAVDGAALAGTAASPGAFRAPAVSGDGRYRAYVADGVNGTGEVVLEARDGSRTNRVRVFVPAVALFSPAGNQVAFVAPDQPTTDLLFPVGPLRIIDPEATEARTLLGGIVVAFFWSPTGKEIAVLRLNDPVDPTPEIVTSEGNGAALARANPAAQEAVAGVPLRLAFVDVATGSIHSERTIQLSDRFVNAVLPYYDQYAHSHRIWSPDGSAIVLPLVGDGDVTQLVVIPADGSAAQTVATGEMGSWSP
jgi:TolB protein